MTPLCFLDTETTGVHPDRQVWEIAMIRRDDAGQSGTQFFVTVDLANADPFGLSVGKFYERHPDGRQLAGNPVQYQAEPTSPLAAANLVASWTHGAHIVGAVPNFDTEVLGTMLRRNGLIPAWHYHLIDVEALAVGYLAGVGQRDAGLAGLAGINLGRITPPWKSHDLSAAVGIQTIPEEEHTALGDATWAMRIYDRVMDLSS